MASAPSTLGPPDGAVQWAVQSARVQEKENTTPMRVHPDESSLAVMLLEVLGKHWIFLILSHLKVTVTEQNSEFIFSRACAAIIL